VHTAQYDRRAMITYRHTHTDTAVDHKSHTVPLRAALQYQWPL